ncbi:MAG: CRTAC1 family protein [Planctomycetota bacterium]|nr:CRTAC1 family protein [Planctomycetota bacterium]
MTSEHANGVPSATRLMRQTVNTTQPGRGPWVRILRSFLLACPLLGACREQPAVESVVPPPTTTDQVTPQSPPEPASVAASPKSPQPETPQGVSGHQRMLRLLAELAAETAQQNPWLGRKMVDVWQTRLDSLAVNDPKHHFLIGHMALAREESRLGAEASVIEHLTAAHALLPTAQNRMPPHIPNQVRYRLGLAYLRLGETQNCCVQHSGESCILPITGQGIHQRPHGSREASKMFLEVLAHAEPGSSDFLKAQWLLNLSAMTIGEYPQGVPAEFRIPTDVFESQEVWPRFPNIAEERGINTFNLSGGAIVHDFDGDGWFDVVTSTLDPAGPLRFFVNSGDGKFTEQTAAAGLTGLSGGLNLEQADYNNDGYMDFVVLRGGWFGEHGSHPNSLVRNNGDGTFTDVTFAAGLGNRHLPTQTGAWSDYDNDGDLDLYIGNEHDGPVDAPAQLFRNNGDGTFRDVARAAGVENLHYAKGVSWGDCDGDRFPELYVSNLNAPNRLYRNRGNGTFVDVAAERNVRDPTYSFPTWFWDYDNDGHLDLYVSSYQIDADGLSSVVKSYLGKPFDEEPARLYRGDGQGTFTDVTAEVQLAHDYTLPMGANFGDLDYDGFLDFYLGTGTPEYEALMPNVMYRNHAGQRFTDITFAGGFGHLQKGHAVAFADLDRDGDLDVFAQTGGAFPGDKFHDTLFDNPGFGRHWLAVQVIGRTSNRDGIGTRLEAVIRAADGTTRSIFRHVNSGGSFGANPLCQTLGLGDATRVEKLVVRWPTSDTEQVFHQLPADQLIVVLEGMPNCLQEPWLKTSTAPAVTPSP